MRRRGRACQPALRRRGRASSARPEAAAAGPLCRDMGDDLATEGDTREWGRGGGCPSGVGAQRPEGGFMWRGQAGGLRGRAGMPLEITGQLKNPLGNKTGG